MRDAHYSSHPLHLCIEVGVAEKPANEGGDFILPDVHHNHAIAPMAERGQIETRIEGQECNISQPAKKHDDLVVLHPLVADIDSDLSCRDPRSSQ
jgi:hypothetical protein